MRDFEISFWIFRCDSPNPSSECTIVAASSSEMPGKALASMKAGAPLLQLQGLAGKDCLQLVGTGKQQPAVRRLIQQFPQGLQALNRQMLGFVKDQ